jgi:hypothetical protein
MIVYFKQSGLAKSYYTTKYDPNVAYSFKTLEDLITLLEEKFHSVDFDDYFVGPTVLADLTFRFHDKEDEAAFLLWSSDGVEI